MRSLKLISVITYLMQITSAMPPPIHQPIWSSSEISISGTPHLKDSSILTVLLRQRRQIVPNPTDGGKSVPTTCRPGFRKDFIGRCVPNRKAPVVTTSAKYTIIQTTNASLLDITTNEISSTTNQLPGPDTFERRSTTATSQPVSSLQEISGHIDPAALVTNPIYHEPLVSATSQKAESEVTKSPEMNDEVIPETTKHNFNIPNEDTEKIYVISETTLSSSISTTHHVPRMEHQRSLPDTVRTTHNCYGRVDPHLPSRAYEDYDY